MPYGHKEKRTVKYWTHDKIRDLRDRYGESQPRFARRLRISTEALRVWEQNRGAPSGPVEALLDRFQEDLEQGSIRPHPDDAPPESGNGKPKPGRRTVATAN